MASGGGGGAYPCRPYFFFFFLNAPKVGVGNFHWYNLASVFGHKTGPISLSFSLSLSPSLSPSLSLLLSLSLRQSRQQLAQLTFTAKCCCCCHTGWGGWGGGKSPRESLTERRATLLGRERETQDGREDRCVDGGWVGGREERRFQ